MKKDKYNPYGFDKQYEFKTYKRIGRDYVKALPKRKRYTTCNTYSEWEKYVINKAPIEILNYGDFIHWLNGQLRVEEIFLEAIKCIMIPVYIALLSISEAIVSEINARYNMPAWKGIVILSIIIVIFSIIILYDSIEKVNFWKDYIKIVEGCRQNKD